MPADKKYLIAIMGTMVIYITILIAIPFILINLLNNNYEKKYDINTMIESYQTINYTFDNKLKDWYYGKIELSSDQNMFAYIVSQSLDYYDIDTCKSSGICIPLTVNNHTYVHDNITFADEYTSCHIYNPQNNTINITGYFNIKGMHPIRQTIYDMPRDTFYIIIYCGSLTMFTTLLVILLFILRYLAMNTRTNKKFVQNYDTIIFDL